MATQAAKLQEAVQRCRSGNSDTAHRALIVQAAQDPDVRTYLRKRLSGAQLPSDVAGAVRDPAQMPVQPIVLASHLRRGLRRSLPLLLEAESLQPLFATFATLERPAIPGPERISTSQRTDAQAGSGHLCEPRSWGNELLIPSQQTSERVLDADDPIANMVEQTLLLEESRRLASFARSASELHSKHIAGHLIKLHMRAIRRLYDACASVLAVPSSSLALASRKVELESSSRQSAPAAAIRAWLRYHECPECGQEFARLSHLQRHLDTVHSNLKPHKCPKCGQEFARLSHLQSHLDAVHSKLKPHKCPKCGQEFAHPQALQRHLDAVHSKLKPHKCPKCGQGFSQINNLQRHLRSVHKVATPDTKSIKTQDEYGQNVTKRAREESEEELELPVRAKRRKTSGSPSRMRPDEGLP